MKRTMRRSTLTRHNDVKRDTMRLLGVTLSFAYLGFGINGTDGQMLFIVSLLVIAIYTSKNRDGRRWNVENDVFGLSSCSPSPHYCHLLVFRLELCACREVSIDEHSLLSFFSSVYLLLVSPLRSVVLYFPPCRRQI